MGKSEFTPGRTEAYAELDNVSAHLDAERASLDFNEFLDKIDKAGIAREIGFAALREAEGNPQAAFDSLQQAS